MMVVMRVVPLCTKFVSKGRGAGWVLRGIRENRHLIGRLDVIFLRR
jgi:hypothetical protein